MVTIKIVLSNGSRDFSTFRICWQIYVNRFTDRSASLFTSDEAPRDANDLTFLMKTENFHARARTHTHTHVYI
jgi:hypothetical protein